MSERRKRKRLAEIEELKAWIAEYSEPMLVRVRLVESDRAFEAWTWVARAFETDAHGWDEPLYRGYFNSWSEGYSTQEEAVLKLLQRIKATISTTQRKEIRRKEILAQQGEPFSFWIGGNQDQPLPEPAFPLTPDYSA